MRRINDKNEVPPELDESVIGTMRINPRSYKKIWNHDIIDRTKYALAGLLYLLLRERSIGNIAKTAAVVLALALWLRIDLVHGTLIFLSFALLWTVETLNSSIEAVVDLVTQESVERLTTGTIALIEYEVINVSQLILAAVLKRQGTVELPLQITKLEISSLKANVDRILFEQFGQDNVLLHVVRVNDNQLDMFLQVLELANGKRPQVVEHNRVPPCVAE